MPQNGSYVVLSNLESHLHICCYNIRLYDHYDNFNRIVGTPNEYQDFHVSTHKTISRHLIDISL